MITHGNNVEEQCGVEYYVLKMAAILGNALMSVYLRMRAIFRK